MNKNIAHFFVSFVALLFTWAGLQAQPAMRTIEIGQLSTTHVLFTSDLTYVDISSPEVIAAKVVEASKNMLAVKARKEFSYQTTISALEANGTMHTFYVRYNSTPSILLVDMRVEDQNGVAQVNTQIRPQQETSQAYQSGGQYSGSSSSQGSGSFSSNVPRHRRQKGHQQQGQGPVNGLNVTSSQTSNFGRGNAPTIEEVMNKDRELYHLVDRSYNLEVSVANIYAYSDLTYIVIEFINKSDIGYDAGDAQFTVENKKLSSKSLTTDKSIWPKSSFGSLACPPRSTTKIGYTIPKLTLPKNEVLKIYIYEKGGSRNFVLTLDDKDVNYAVSPIK